MSTVKTAKTTQPPMQITKSQGCWSKVTVSCAGSSVPLFLGPKMEQIVTPTVMKMTATKEVFVGVSRTPQHPTIAKTKLTTIVSPAKGAMSDNGVMANTTTSRPAAVMAKRTMPPQNHELRYHGIDTKAGPCARFRHSIPSAEAKVPSNMRHRPTAHIG